MPQWVSSAVLRAVLKLIYTSDVDIVELLHADVMRLINLLKLDFATTPESSDSGFSFNDAHHSTIIYETNDSGNVSHNEVSVPPPRRRTIYRPASRRSSIIPATVTRRESVRLSIAKCRIVAPHRFKKYPRRKGRSLMTFGANLSCRFCPDVGFYTARARTNHELTCSFNFNSRDYYFCDICGSSFLFKGNLRNHMRKHLSEAVDSD